MKTEDQFLLDHACLKILTSAIELSMTVYLQLSCLTLPFLCLIITYRPLQTATKHYYLPTHRSLNPISYVIVCHCQRPVSNQLCDEGLFHILVKLKKHVISETK
jgi:hypothetical protein